MCTAQSINADINPNGVIISTNYPNYAQNALCTLKLQTSSNKAFKIYITDLDMEDSVKYEIKRWEN